VVGIVKPTEDLMFRKLFSSVEHRDIISGFLGDVLGLNVRPEDIVIKNPYSIKSYLEEKRKADAEVASRSGTGRIVTLREVVHDVTLAIIDTADVTIEMQLAEPNDFLKRMHYYLDDVYLSNYNRNSSRGDRYATLKPVISLNILDFILFPGDERALRSFSYRDDDTGEQLGSNIRTEQSSRPLKQIGFFELQKSGVSDATVADWRDFIKTGVANPGASQVIQEAAKIVQYQNLAPEEREVIDTVEKTIDTYYALLSGAEKQGWEQGREQGREEIAARLLERGFPVLDVASLTGLEEAAIKGILSAMANGEAE
jgi:predicted transposase/invertase (TIGR01784 family)